MNWYIRVEELTDIAKFDIFSQYNSCLFPSSGQLIIYGEKYDILSSTVNVDLREQLIYVKK